MLHDFEVGTAFVVVAEQLDLYTAETRQKFPDDVIELDKLPGFSPVSVTGDFTVPKHTLGTVFDIEPDNKWATVAIGAHAYYVKLTNLDLLVRVVTTEKEAESAIENVVPEKNTFQMVSGKIVAQNKKLRVKWSIEADQYVDAATGITRKFIEDEAVKQLERQHPDVFLDPKVDTVTCEYTITT